MKETDLFKPVRTLFLEQGYDVQGEILAADVFAVKGDEIIIVELKLQISLKLIYQTMERQKVAHRVYLAAPKLVVQRHIKNHAQFIPLLKRLSIGLISVTLERAEVMLEPEDINQPAKRGSSSKKRLMLHEFHARDQHQTIGGTNQKKMTFYREQVIEIAKALHTLQEASTKLIKDYTRIEKTADILSKNFDGWFMKNEKGLHQLSPKGEKEIQRFLF